MYSNCTLSLFPYTHHFDAVRVFPRQQHVLEQFKMNMLSLLHMLMLFLLFMQLIPSLSLLLPATWPIRPFLYRSFPSAVDILCLNSAASPLRWCEKNLLGHTVGNLLCLGRIIRAVRWGPLWSVFNQVRFFSVRLQSYTLSFKDIRLWQSGKCPSITPSWEIFYFVFYDAEKTTYVLFFLFLMGHKTLHQVRSLSFVFPLIQGILIMLLQYEFLKKKKKQVCCSSILEKPLHCFFLLVAMSTFAALLLFVVVFLSENGNSYLFTTNFTFEKKHF